MCNFTMSDSDPLLPTSKSSRSPLTRNLKLKSFLRDVIYSSSLMFFLWGALYGLFNEEMLPNGFLFPFFILFIISSISGQLIKLIKLPPLIAMLIVGLGLRNLTNLHFNQELSSNLRNFALIVILLRAGLNLDIISLKQHLGTVAKLSIIPLIVESAVIAISGFYILKLPLNYSVVLGFVLPPLSSAVIVPAMIDLQDNRYLTKSIPSILIAATSIDNLIAITLIGISLGFLLPANSTFMNVLKGPIEIVIGLCFGFATGFINSSFPKTNGARLIMLISGGCCAIYASRQLLIPSAGPIASLIISLIAGHSWRQLGPDVINPISYNLKQIWQLISEPFLFGLIGAEVDLSLIDFRRIGFTVLIIVIGLIGRFLITFLVSGRSGFSNREKLFISLAFLSKATVQAAFGPVALDMARISGAGVEVTGYATEVLNAAVMSILVTAPLGSILINLTGHRLLQKQQLLEI